MQYSGQCWHILFFFLETSCCKSEDEVKAETAVWEQTERNVQRPAGEVEETLKWHLHKLNVFLVRSLFFLWLKICLAKGAVKKMCTRACFPGGDKLHIEHNKCMWELHMLKQCDWKKWMQKSKRFKKIGSLCKHLCFRRFSRRNSDS